MSKLKVRTSTPKASTWSRPGKPGTVREPGTFLQGAVDLKRMQRYQEEFLGRAVPNRTAVTSSSELHDHLCGYRGLNSPGPREDEYPVLRHL